MDRFTLNGKEYDFRFLLKDELNQEQLSTFEFVTLTNIRNWLLGHKTFSFQTSGSTGKPKAISFSRQQVMKSALRSIKTFNLLPGQTALCCLNTQFVAGFMMLIRAIEGKMNLLIAEPDSNPLASMDDQRIDFVAMTPNQVRSSMDVCPDKFKQVRTILIGGAGLHSQLETPLRSLDSEVFHSYAMTETLTHVAIRNISKKEIRYKALNGVTFDQDDKDCLIVNDQLLGWSNLKTNDVVKLVDDHTFEWIGRIDNVINSGGIKIHIEELENKIRHVLPELGVADAICIVARPDVKLTNKLVLLLESRASGYDEKHLLSKLRLELPKYHAPKEIIFVSALFQTKTGKIDRRKNADAYL